MNKKRWIIAGSIVAVVILFIIGVFFVVNRKPAPVVDETENVLQNNQEVKQVEPTVKVALKKTPDGKKAVISISGVPEKYTAIEYTFSYITSDNASRGVIGTIEVDGPSIEKEIVLGSCSTNVCTYDEGVSDVKVELRFNTDTGEFRVFEKTFSL